MTQSELTAIWEALDLGHAVPGWGRMIGSGEVQVLVEIAVDHSWNRNADVGRWAKRRG
jgi:hypothetical protein